ncbi:MAG TPA: ABC transporter ATP-binding protein, partial [Candidatus Methylacidiphilales bacterium]
YLAFFARAFGLPPEKREARIAAVVGELGLGPWLEHEVESLSAGWQRRLALGRTLLSPAPIVLLDEPAAGLDIAARAALLPLIRSLRNEGRTVVVTSHILPELEELADRFGILDQGAWVPVSPDGRLFFTPDDLRSNFGTGRCRIAVREGEEERAAGLLLPLRPDARAEGGAVFFSHPPGEAEAVPDAVRILAEAGIGIRSVEPLRQNLSDTVRSLLTQPDR